MTKEILLVFPHQLFENHSAFTKEKIICFLEDERFFSDFMFNKKKLIFHRASMRAFAKKISASGYEVIYFEYPSVRDEKIGVFNYAKKQQVNAFHYIDPTDNLLEQQLIKTAHYKDIKLIKHDAPCFLATASEIGSWLGQEKHYSMASFYTNQRKRYTILVDNNKPIGGVWSFDKDNRKKLPNNYVLPKIWFPKVNAFVSNAASQIEKLFPKNPGNSENFIFPVTHADAQKWLEDFLHHRLNLFGDYQDALAKKLTIGYHFFAFAITQ